MLSHILPVYFCNDSHELNSFIFLLHSFPVIHSQASMYKVTTAKMKQKLLQLKD